MSGARGWPHYTWSTENSRVSIVIPTRDNLHHLSRCLDPLLEGTRYPNYEVLLVDTGSRREETWEYYDRLCQGDRVSVVRYDGTFNYSRANNLGAGHAAGSLLLFLNDDIGILDPDWLTEMVRWAERETIGAVGAKLLYEGDGIQHAGIVLGLGGHAGHLFYGAQEGEMGLFGSTEWYRNFLAVTGACMMVPKAIFERVGGFDEDYQLIFSDVVMCLEIVKRGYRVLYNPFVRLIHHEGASRGKWEPLEDMERAYEELHDRIEAGDPYFNPNLSHTRPSPQLLTDEPSRLDHLEDIMNRARRAQRR